MAENLSSFGHQGHAQAHDLTGLGPADLPAQENDAAFLVPDQAGDGFEQRALAGAVGPDDGDDGPFLDLEADPFRASIRL